MKRLAYLSLALLVAASCLGGESRFKAADGCFTLDGKPFIVKAAELHYPRIPRAYWDHRIKMSKALGMNFRPAPVHAGNIFGVLRHGLCTRFYKLYH